MNSAKLNPLQALNKAYRKVKPTRNKIETFKNNLIGLIDRINEVESEEFHKNLIVDFFKQTYYGNEYFINTKERSDLVIHSGKSAQTPVNVIIETKRPSNRYEMTSTDNINTKALQELVLYYLRERITLKNLEVKYLITTNIYEWFIFDANIFEKIFAQNRKLVAQFTDFEAGTLTGTKTDFFYQELAKPAIDAAINTISYTHFDIRDYEKPLRNVNQRDDNKFIALYKLLSPEHLLKLPFANDSNSLDKVFYSELLHIIGLTEIKEKSKKLIQRHRADERESGSLLENAITQLDSLDKISRLSKPQSFGTTHEERLFNVALELVITWVNRILFLKLLEAQLTNYHKGDNSYTFLNLDMVANFDDLNSLFFSVLARQPLERNDDVKTIFAKVPYLNSSLFEPTEIEHNTIVISNLRDERTLPILTSTVLKNRQGKKRSGQLNTLEYLFEFLNAYDFGSEGAEAVQEDNKTLINASVLGLIFEKINGYKDGSFFTPGFITMYMCRETIRRAVVQKFNDAKGWNCQNIDQLYDRIDNKVEANSIINSLKICDPAVGSGHFLVSALNEIIAIKSDLKILLDRNSKTLRDYQFEVVNDDLIITDDNGLFFDYNPKSTESRRIQEALFHEKQTIIENCLFGVDINTNSVKICRLRLWIELLKNAYYTATSNYTELETLPNIDINIKCGNSLISRYALDADIKKALRKSKWTIDSYRLAVMSYRNAENKEHKRQMETLIDSIKSDFESEINHTDKRVSNLDKLKNKLTVLIDQPDFFEIPKAKKAQLKKETTKVIKAIQKLEAEIADIKNNKIYENAFEWRFEFPEVLNDDGDFIGFDVIIGNPPYMQLQKNGGVLANIFKICDYETFERCGDIYCLFYEHSYRLLRTGGVLTFITSNKWMRANYGKSMRKYFIRNGNIAQLIDFGDAQFFENATTYTNILIWAKDKKTTETEAWNLSKANASTMSLEELLKQEGNYELLFNENSFVITNSAQAKIKNKIETTGIPLKDWDIAIYRGVLTGLNEAFIIDGKTRDKLIAQDPKSSDILKPILRGRDVKKYKAVWSDLWLINTHNGYGNIPCINVQENYLAIWDYLNKFNNEHNKALEQRSDRGSHWSNLRNCAYLEDFEKEKILYAEIVFDSAFYYDTMAYYPEATSFIITGERLKFLTAMLNSKLLTYAFENFYAGGDLRGNTFRYKKIFIEQLPIPQISSENQLPFEKLADQILSTKKENPNADTSELESKIDRLVYKLYGLTEAEIAIIENVSKI